MLQSLLVCLHKDMICHTDQDLLFAVLHVQAHVQYQDTESLNQTFADVKVRLRPSHHHFLRTCNDLFLPLQY